MSQTLETTTTTSNPLKAARARFISGVLKMELPSYPANPSPADHESFARCIREFAQWCDGMLAAIGSEVRDNAVTTVDRHLFAGSFLGAVDGNETGVCEEQAEKLRDYAEERRSERRSARGGW